MASQLQEIAKASNRVAEAIKNMGGITIPNLSKVIDEDDEELD